MTTPTVLHFRAMGSPCRIVADPAADLAVAEVRRLIQMLEQRWSRFLPDSEVSALNRVAGNVTVVSEPTYRLVKFAVQGSTATGGLFNPLMLDQLEAHGYRDSWGGTDPTPDGQPIDQPTGEPIVLYPEINAVRLPQGSRFDPGGIGKGLAVDMAIELCQSLGLSMASVELGGDLRVYGEPWFGPKWSIEVASPFDTTIDLASFTIAGGAVTTSTSMKRSWVVNGFRYHHLLDPTTGLPSTSDIASVTTCSEVAWWAEIVAKSALLVGSNRFLDLLDELCTPGAAITVDGRTLTGGSGPNPTSAADPVAETARSAVL